MDSETPDDVPDLPEGASGGRTLRVLLNAASGAIPLAGGVLSAAAGAWSERDQERINDFLKHWIEMLLAEMKEKRQTILEITARLDLHDEKIAERVKSTEYQALLRKAFRDWAGTESEEKRKLVRNLLSNAASASFVSDDVIKLFLEWIRDYSELHFAVIGAIYNDAGITRARIWQKLCRAAVREDSADADLFKLIIHDLSTGRIIRQHRETDYAGNFIAKQHRRGPALPKGTQRTMRSAFDDEEEYELTSLGQQFVHYAMTDVPPKIIQEHDDRDYREGHAIMSAATHVLSVSEWLKLPVVSMPTLRDKAETGAVVMVAKVGFLLATEADCKQANGLGRTGTEWKTFVAYGHDPGRRPRISASAAD